MPSPRFLQLDDIPAYRTLRAENLIDAPWSSGATHGNDPTESSGYLEKIIAANDQHLFVLDHPTNADQLASAAGLLRYPSEKTSHRAMIWGVYTTPPLRQRGYARQVLQHAIESAKQWEGLRYIALSVSASSESAIALYESLGFKQWGTEPDVVHIDGKDYDELYMALKL